MRTEVESSIIEIREHYHERISLEDLANSVFLSPFHLSRIFRRETGLPPARYVSAVRLEEAKRRLLTTETNIAEISADVGYHSLGTFTSRFTNIVGISPGRYRRFSHVDSRPDTHISPDPPLACYGAIRSIVRSTEHNDPVLVGVFRAERGATPLGCTLINSGSSWTLENVPTGRWFVQAISLGKPRETYALETAAVGPVEVPRGRTVPVCLSLLPRSLAPMPQGTPELRISSLLEIFADRKSL